MLVLEDLHWSDRSTRDLLAFLVRNLRAERLVLVATYRSDELYRGHPLRPLLAELDRGRRSSRLDLRPFTRAELAEQLEGILGARPERGRVESVFERSQGNAFFAEELATHRGGELPPVLQRHPARADREPQRGGAGAAAGRRGERRPRAPNGCSRRSRTLSEAQREEALREAVEHRLLVPAGEDVYAFRHALLREAVYQELLPGERNRLHAACGEALAAGGRDGAADLAYHWYAAHDLPRALSRVGRGGAGGRAAVRLRGGARALRARARAVGAAWPTPRRAPGSVSRR